MTLIKEYQDDIVSHLNESLESVLTEWATAKAAEVGLIELLAIQKEEIRVQYAGEISELKESLHNSKKDLAKAYAAMSKNSSTITAQAERIATLAPLTDKVRDFRLHSVIHNFYLLLLELIGSIGGTFRLNRAY